MARNTRSRLWAVVLSSVAVILTAVYLSLTNGSFDLTVTEVVQTLLRIDPNPDHDLVVFDFRLPRIVLSALVGCALGIAGVVIQGVTRNGLADPGLLGINAGAGMAVVLFMLLYQGSLDTTGWLAVMAMPAFGFIGGLVAMAVIFAFAREHGRLDPQRLILVGLAVSSGFGAITMYLSLKMNPQDFEMAAVWLAGSIYGANWRLVAAALPWMVVLPPLLWRRAHVLDVFQLGEDSATGLGAHIEREKNWFLIGSAGLVAASVAVAGSVNFVGLIAPHFARRLVGLSHRRLLPVSGLIGMAMTVAGDFIGRTVFAPAQLAVGIVISIIGVPYFVYLLMRSRK